jgi:DNA-binding MarR family transcriptional regulator
MPSDSPLSERSTELESRLAELPPSAKYVFTILWYEGKLTQQELRKATLLPRRTVSYSVEILEESGLIEKRIHGSDARVREYTIANAANDDSKQ